MLFQSQEFVLIFWPLAALAYYAVARSTPARQYMLIFVSLVFYGWWDARFIILLVGQISISWAMARLHERTRRTASLYLGIGLNLASLGTFKYLDFLLASFEDILGIALPRAHILLPIGISFFSFQLISYLVDRLRNDAPLYSFRPFALFVMFFPHLIAGPLVRHNELVPQFDADPRREGRWRNIGTGLTLFTLGIAKKVPLAGIADPLFAQARDTALTFGKAWTAALSFTFQLFLDFSAYTEMAIGIALVFGLLLPENFRRPYLSTDIRDFWQRWHISPSKFIRDYFTFHSAAADMARRVMSLPPFSRWVSAASGMAQDGPLSCGGNGMVRVSSCIAAGGNSTRQCPHSPAGHSPCCLSSPDGCCFARLIFQPPPRYYSRWRAATA